MAILAHISHVDEMNLSLHEMCQFLSRIGDRVLPDEWNGVTEVEPPDGDTEPEKLGNGS
jgi:hypothetical protein